MDEGGTRPINGHDSSTSSDSDRSDRRTTTRSESSGRTFGESGRQSSNGSGDGATGYGGERGEGTGTQAPAPPFSRAPILDPDEGTIGRRSTTTRTRTTKAKQEFPTPTAKVCQSVVSALSRGGSWLLTRSNKLQLTPHEKIEIGGALHESLSTLPSTSFVLRLLSVVGPWSALIDSLITAMVNRAVWVRQQQIAQMQAAQEPADPANANETHDFIAPNPAEAI